MKIAALVLALALWPLMFESDVEVELDPLVADMAVLVCVLETSRLGEAVSGEGAHAMEVNQQIIGDGLRLDCSDPLEPVLIRKRGIFPIKTR